MVTGAGRGIGRAIAIGLAETCSAMALVSRTRTELEETAGEIRKRSCRAEVLAGDARDPAQVASVVASAIAALGRIDVLVNAAGVCPIYTRAELVEPADWDLILEVNLRGTFLFCREVGRHMLERGSGAIVNISSVGATTGLSRIVAYNASKAGIEALTRTLAVEWAERGVRVNAVAPAFVNTDMTGDLLRHPHFGETLRSRTPMKRFGEPHEVVGAVRFLASDDAAYVTGSTLFVDGGWHAA